MWTVAARAGLWVLLLSPVYGEPAVSLKALYEARQWFQLRELVLATCDPPPFYRAAVAVAFNDYKSAAPILNRSARSSPSSWEAGEARQLLRRIEECRDLNKPVRPVRPSRIRYTMRQGSLLVPLSINGHPVEYLFDTGAARSVVSHSEALRLGLKRFAVRSAVSDAMGKPITATHLAVAKRLKAGDAEFRDVLFMVFPDSTPLFEGRKPGEQGILGLPSIQRLEAFRIDRNGNFYIAPPSTFPIQPAQTSRSTARALYSNSIMEASA